MDITALAIRKKLKDMGVEDSVIDEIIAKMQEAEQSDDIQKIQKVREIAGVMQDVPPEARSVVSQYMTSMFAQPKQDNTIEEIKKTMMELKMIESIFGNNSQDKELVQTLLEEMKELKEQALQAELQRKDEEMKQILEEVKNVQQTMVDVMMRMSENNNQRQYDYNEEESVLERYARTIEELKRTKEMMKELGLLKEAQDEPDGTEISDPDKLAQLLQRHGYVVKRPLSPEEVERRIQEELKKKEAEIKKQVEEELGAKQEKMRWLMDMIVSIISGITNATSTTGGKDELKKVASVVAQKLATGEGGEGGDGGDGGAEAE